MAKSTASLTGLKTVGALFDDDNDANSAVDELVKKGYPMQNITVMLQLDEKQDRRARKKALENAGYQSPDQRYFDEAIEEGKTLVSVTNIDESKTGDVIAILNKHGSHYNPDGSRNVRDDVVGMTTGAAVGATAGALGGPVGAAIGAVAGGAIGAAIGSQMERNE